MYIKNVDKINKNLKNRVLKGGILEMIRIMLACAGGMSTSLLMNKMKDEADKRGIEVTVNAIGEKSIAAHLGEFDVLLLGPQVRYVLKDAQKVVNGTVPVEVIDMRDYGTMNGAKVLDKALEIYNEFYGK